MNEPIKCTKCGSYDLDTRPFDQMDRGSVTRTVDCDDCGHQWIEVFLFSRIIEE